MALEQLPGRRPRGRDGRPDRRRRARDAADRGRRRATRSPCRTCSSPTPTPTTSPRPTRTRAGSTSRCSRTRSRPSAWTRVDGTLADGDEVTAGDLTITALLTPGHSPGHLSFLVNGTRLLHGRRPLPRHRRRHDARQLREPAPLDHGRAHEASARDPRPPRPHRSDHDRGGVGGERVHRASGAASTRPATSRAP